MVADRADWLTTGRFAVLLVLLIMGCFSKVVTGAEAFVCGDAGQFAYPVAFYFRQCFWHGSVPLWNPLNNCGLPFMAQWNTLTLYPPSLFYLLLPVPWSFGIFCLGHLFLAGLGMYLLAYHWTNHRLAAGLAGVVFAFNGMTWYGLMLPHLLVALAWMPWVIWTTERAWREGGRWLFPAILCGTMQMLSGGAEAILQTWLLLAAWWLMQLFRRDISWRPSLLRAFAVVMLVAGLAAVQLLPFLELLAHSLRLQYGNIGAGGFAAMPLSGWANYLVPLFHCVRQPQGVFLQAGQPWIASYYLGTGVIALAILGIWRAPGARTGLLAGLIACSLILALGSRGGMYDWFVQLVPIVGFMRFPVKFVILATFCLPLLAAMGLRWLLTVPEENWRRESKNLMRVAGLLLIATALIAGWAWAAPVVGENPADTARNAAGRALFLILVLVAAVWLRRPGQWYRLGQAGFIALLWFDVFTHAPNLSPTVSAAALEPGVVRQFFHWTDQLQLGQSRALETRAARRHLEWSGSQNLALDTSGRRMALAMNFNLLDGVPKFDGFFATPLSDFYKLYLDWFFATNEASGLKDFLGISHVSNGTNIFTWDSRNSFLPMITAGQKPVFATDAEARRRVLADDFEPLRIVYLPFSAQPDVRVNEAPDARILSARVSADRVNAEVQASAPFLVVIAQSFYPEWRAFVDGHPATIWRANGAFQAVQVAGGKHALTLVYKDRAFLGGAMVSLLSGVLLLGVWLKFRGRWSSTPG